MGGVLDFLSGGQREAARDAQSQAVEQMRGLQLPNIEDMKLELQQYVSAGQLTPQQAEAILQERSSLESFQTDPRLRQAQMDALVGLQQISQEGGLTAADRGKLQQAQMEAGAYERGQREAILQNAQQRGIAGSGLELMSKLQAQQSGADRVAMEGFKTAQLAQERALQALKDSGTVAGDIRTTDFGEAEKRAASADTINKFNTQARQAALDTNVLNANKAAEFNLNRRQEIANKNVDFQNEARKYNAGLAQQDFENRYRRAGGTASALGSQATGLSNQASETLGVIGGVGKSIFGAMGEDSGSSGGKAKQVATMAATAGSDRSLKQDVQPLDSAALLDELTGYKYKYKNESDGKGEQIGVMAQDLQKVAPHAVSARESDGKLEIDYGKLGGTILAALADMNDRLKNVEDK